MNPEQTQALGKTIEGLFMPNLPVLQLGLDRQKAEAARLNEASLEANRQGMLAEQIRNNNALRAHQAAMLDQQRQSQRSLDDQRSAQAKLYDTQATAAEEKMKRERADSMVAAQEALVRQQLFKSGAAKWNPTTRQFDIDPSMAGALLAAYTSHPDEVTKFAPTLSESQVKGNLLSKAPIPVQNASIEGTITAQDGTVIRNSSLFPSLEARQGTSIRSLPTLSDPAEAGLPSLEVPSNTFVRGLPTLRPPDTAAPMGGAAGAFIQNPDGTAAYRPAPKAGLSSRDQRKREDALDALFAAQDANETARLSLTNPDAVNAFNDGSRPLAKLASNLPLLGDYFWNNSFTPAEKQARTDVSNSEVKARTEALGKSQTEGERVSTRDTFSAKGDKNADILRKITSRDALLKKQADRLEARGAQPSQGGAAAALTPIKQPPAPVLLPEEVLRAEMARRAALKGGK